MILLLMMAFNLSIPINYGQLSFNPVYNFQTYTLIGDSSFSVIPRNLLINGFYLPEVRDISLFYSKSFRMRITPNSIEFLPRKYDSTVTLLNSSKGTNSYTYAGLLFSGHYRPFYYSISADFASVHLKKITAFNPGFAYSGAAVESRLFFYKFNRDSVSYVKTLLWDNRLLKSKKTLKFFYSKLRPDLSVGGIQIGGQERGINYVFTAERTSNDKSLIAFSMGLKNKILVGLKKPFQTSKIYPLSEVNYRWKKVNLRVWGDVVEDSVEIYRVLAGLVYQFNSNNYVFAGYGNSSSAGLFAGHNPFFAGKIHWMYEKGPFTAGIAGNFQKFLRDSSYKREVNLRSFIAVRKPFGRENYIEVMGILDYFGIGNPHFSGRITLLLFKSVIVRLEEINLTKETYPFTFPENSVNFYRISVATYLKD